jgi:uncharacterized protein
MDRINKDLLNYIETKIFPEYEKNDEGHRRPHIEYVIRRSIKFAEQFEDINLDMLYTAAAYHDIGHHLDKNDEHEILSGEIFYKDEKMKEFFNEEERLIIKAAIEDHRASLEGEPRNNYGKIISSADRTIDLDTTIRRAHSYRLKHSPDSTLEEMIDDAYEHIRKKYGKDGYAKSYVVDKELDDFREEVASIITDKDKFRKKYMEVNNLKEL